MKKAFFTGNVANDPELRGQNKNVLAFRVICNGRAYNAETEQWEDTAEGFDFVQFGNRAKAIAEFLEKGSPVTIEATPCQNSWTDENGKTRSRVEFVVDDIVVHYKSNKPAA